MRSEANVSAWRSGFVALLAKLPIVAVAEEDTAAVMVPMAEFVSQ